MTDQVSVRVIRSLAEIEDIRGVWSSWRGHRDADIDVYLALLHSGINNSRPYLILLERAGHPDAMLVGTIGHAELPYRIGYLRFSTSSVRLLSFVYGGFLGNQCPENSKRMVHEIIRSLRRGEGDVATLSWVSKDSPMYHLATREPNFLCRDNHPVTTTHWSLTLPATPEEFLRHLSGKLQDQRWKKLLRHYPNKVKMSCFSGGEDLQRVVREAEEIAKKTYQRSLGVGFSDSPGIRRLLNVEAQRGWLRSYFLHIDNKPCAFWITSLRHGTVSSEFTGYDPSYSKYSPGKFLIVKAIEDFCRESSSGKAVSIDFGPGDAEWKATLGDRRWEEATVYVFAPNLRGFTLNFLRSCTTVADRLAKKLLERTNLLRKVKKIWRNHEARKAGKGSCQQFSRAAPGSQTGPTRAEKRLKYNHEHCRKSSVGR